MEEQPKFIKEFSKEKSPEERQRAAQKIKAKRAEYFEKKQAKLQEQSKTEQKIKEKERVLQEKFADIKGLESKIEELSSSGFKRLKHYFELKGLRAQLAIGQKTYDELKEKLSAEEQEFMFQLNDSTIPPELEDAKKMLDEFYKEQKEKWAKSEYTREDITKYFSEEYLTSLSLKDYILLLKRFPSEMVTHITRQGVRDHRNYMHSGEYKEFNQGFTKILEDGRLRSLLSICLVAKEKGKAIEEFMKLNRCKTKKEALEYLDSYFEPILHFAEEEVADEFYGSEKCNEIFISFPKAHIAAEYYFRSEIDAKARGRTNDLWVWENEKRGMDINAGIIFLPKDTEVSSKTGSRYELDENMKPIVNEEYIALIKNFLQLEKFVEFIKQAKDALFYFNLDRERYEEQYKKLCEELSDKFNISDSQLQHTVLDYTFLIEVNWFIQNNDIKKELEQSHNFETVSSIIQKSLMRYGIYFKKAKNTISSGKFWENYFSKHPNQRPSKIVYYKGANPTSALQEWKSSAGLEKEETSVYWKSSEKYIKDDSKPTLRAEDIGRFRTIAKEIIDKKFGTA